LQAEGFEAVAAAVAAYTPEMAEAITSVPAETIRTVARGYALAAEIGSLFTPNFQTPQKHKPPPGGRALS